MPDPITLSFADGRRYDVQFRPLDALPATLAAADVRPGRCLLVTDEHVAAHYRGPVGAALTSAGWTPHVHTLPPGEATKRAEMLHRIYDEALRWGMDRQTPVLAVGGGVIGDLAGFAAATLLRGVPLVHVPTSLIAQVDSSIGGKTGINHATGKNLIGSFYQPALVHTDTACLRTLPMREWTSGLAEVAKHALLTDGPLRALLAKHRDALYARTDDAPIPSMVRAAVAVKAEVVQADEREAGRRAVLNLGHTFAHAIEAVAGYGRFTHGGAVALGLRAALHLSSAAHPSFPLDACDALVRPLAPVDATADLSFEALYEAMRADKKNRGGRRRFVLLRAPGDPYVTSDCSRAAVARAWTFATS